MGKERVWMVTRQKAVSLLPYLRWIAEGAPYVSDRRAAKSLVGKLEGVRGKEWKQLLISKKELDLLTMLYDSPYYEEIKEPVQLRLL